MSAQRCFVTMGAARPPETVAVDTARMMLRSWELGSRVSGALDDENGEAPWSHHRLVRRIFAATRGVSRGRYAA